MEIQIPYGKETEVVNIPTENISDVIYPNEVEVTSPVDPLITAIDNPLNSVSFERFLSDARDVLILVNDGTRPTPTCKVIEIIHDRIKDRDVKFLVATGIHRAATEEEYQLIFGDYYTEFADRIYMHDAKANDQLQFVGKSKNGTEMWINRMGMEAHKIIIIGSVEPHYFAGYTGGRKSFLPGIAGYKTVEQNHKYALRPEAKALALEGNPVHEDMIDALRTIADKEIFSIQTILDRERRIYAATAGHINDSFLAAIEKANDVFCVELKKKADIVVSIAPYPMDVDLYQSQKALDNGKLALKENGILIMVAKCRTGVGPPTFFKLLSSCDSPQQVLDKIDKEYKLGYHKAAKMAEIATWGEMWGVTDLDDGDMDSIFIKPFHSIQQAVEKAIEIKGPDAEVIFLMEGSITVPMI